MTDETPQAETTEGSTEGDPPKAKFFRKKFTTARLPADSAVRQGQVATLAFLKLGREEATAFLNTFDEALGGRPLDLAVASADGLRAVEAAIAARAGSKG
ncbi:antitoxin Xre/MbcA/ParS toxin-binding domain-containing protein [Sphingomonas sp. dw_22]|uniref:antitoxin Xre/MbcA/ParS toxin-binding domain-containing protein n=1 Tax=Sphingomonas sp. dw_22 TaxID=2721175 RepID=UPI001BD32A3D|nr:antitoxin Xre/MbcA/ParS toxin-binding domain-containing protein [Sphingomonas sp. dw_22]